MDIAVAVKFNTRARIKKTGMEADALINKALDALDKREDFTMSGYIDVLEGLMKLSDASRKDVDFLLKTVAAIYKELNELHGESEKAGYAMGVLTRKLDAKFPGIGAEVFTEVEKDFPASWAASPSNRDKQVAITDKAIANFEKENEL